MARYAQLPDNTYLEFPDDTPDDVMSKAVKGQLGIKDESWYRSTPEKGGVQDQATDLASFGTGVADIVTGSIGGLGGTLYGMGGMLAGTHGSMKDVLAEGSRGFENFSTSGILGLEGQRERPGYKAAMKPVDLLSKAAEAGGKGVATGAEYMGMNPAQAKELGAGTEVALGFAPLPLVGPRAKSPMQRLGDANFATQQQFGGEIGAANSLHDRLMAEVHDATAPYDQAILNELDNTMIQYGKELQAPQLGLGGKVAKHEDQLGRREKGEFSSQMAWDEEMRARAEEQKSYVDEQHGEALKQGVDHLDQYGATTKGTTLEHAPSPVRPFQVEQLRGSRISEGEATQIYLKPKFERTLEEKLKLEDYEASLKGPRLTDVVDDSGIPIEDGAAPRRDVWSIPLREMQRTVPDRMRGTEIPSVRDQLQYIADDSRVPVYKEIAKLLLDDDTFNPRFNLSKDVMIEGKNYGGSYSPRNHQVNIRIDHAGNESLLIHESVHAYTSAAIEGVLRNHRPDMFGPLAHPVRRLIDLHANFVKDWDYSRGPALYGMKNVKEFVAEAFSSPTFQAELARTPLPAHLRKSKIATYWDKFVESIGKLLGFNKDSQNYLAATIQAGADLIQGTDKSTRMFYDQWLPEENIGGGYEFKDFKADVEAKGVKLSNKVLKGMYDKQQAKGSQPKAHPQADAVKTIQKIPGLSQIQRKYVDSRPFEEMVGDAEKHKDISFLNKHVINKMMQGKFTATDHPVLSWVSSKVHWIKNDSLKNANNKLHGKSKDNPEPGTYNYVWRQLSAKERGEVNQVGWAFNGEQVAASTKELQRKAQELFGRELSRKQLEAYKDRVRINHEVLADINKKLEENGKEAIQPLPNYWSPNQFDGPYLVKFIDPKTGDTKKVVSAYLEPNTAKLQKDFPDYRIESQEVGLKGSMDFDQIEWVLRHLNKELRDPASKAIAEGLRRQGFRRHGLKRDMVEGGLGSGKSRKDLRAYEEVTEKYIRGAYEYIANRDLDSTFNQVLDEKKLDGSPNAKALALESIDAARGGANAAMEGLSRVLGEVFRGSIRIGTAGALKLPQRALRDLTRQSNKVMTTLLLGFGNLTNIAAQTMQAPTFMPPKLLSMAAENGHNPAVAFKAMAKAYADMVGLDKNNPDIQKLKEIGALEATFKYDWSTYAADADPRYGHKMRDHLTGLSTLSYLEANAVRKPASLMFLHMLRELGYDKVAKSADEIYYVAKEMTDQYMVSTKWYEKPHMFSRSGLVGTAFSPLQSFTTTWVGMLREYGKLAKEGAFEGSPAKTLPLATFLAMNVMTAGMLGLIGIKEWDAIANFLNKHYGYSLPTGTEWVLSNVKNRTARFGVLSNAIGMHIGASFQAPTVTGSFAPGVQFMGNSMEFAKQMGRSALAPTGLTSEPTSVEKRDAIKGVAPRFSPFPMANYGDIEKTYTPEGMPYQDTAGNAGPITRDAFDWTARRLGTYSNKEAEQKTENYLLKREGDQRSDRLSKSMNRVVDTILMNPDNFGVVFDRELAKLEEDNFSGDDIKNALKREILSKMLESDERMLGKNSSKSAYLHQLLRELQ